MKTDHKFLTIKRISSEQSDDIYYLLYHSRQEYIQYFTPFSIDRLYIRQQLEKAKQDLFFGFYLFDEFIAFYMLRGFDEGFKVPSYGVFVSEKYKSLGIGRLSLQHAITHCKINHLKKIMLKVHPENVIAKKMYERIGFYQVGTDQKNNNLIFYKDL